MVPQCGVQFNKGGQSAEALIQHWANLTPCQLAQAAAQRWRRQRGDPPRLVVTFEVGQPRNDIFQARWRAPMALGREVEYPGLGLPREEIWLAWTRTAIAHSSACIGRHASAPYILSRRPVASVLSQGQETRHSAT